MTVTEELSRKAVLHAVNTLGYTLAFLRELLKGLAEKGLDLSKAVAEEVQKANNERRYVPGFTDDKSLYKAAGKLNENVSHLIVRSSSLDDLKTCLENQDVMYAVASVDNEGSKMVLFLRKDRDLVQKAITELNANRMGKAHVSTRAIIKSCNGGKVSCIDFVSEAELRILSRLARENRFRYSAEQNPEGGMTLFFAPEHEEGIRLALAAADYALKDPKVAEYAGHYEQTLQETREKIQDSTKRTYFVSRKNPLDYILLYSDGYAVYKEGNLTHKVARTSDGFDARALSEIQDMYDAVPLTETEFADGVQESDFAAKYAVSPLPPDYRLDRQTSLFERVFTARRPAPEKINMDTVGLQSREMEMALYLKDGAKVSKEEFEKYKENIYEIKEKYTTQTYETRGDLIIKKDKEKDKEQEL